MRKVKALFVVFLFCSNYGFVQNEYAIPLEKETSQTMEGWLGLYTKYRLTDKFFYYGEYHYRRKNYMKEMGQVYLRFGATYLVNKNFELTGGIVTPVYWANESMKGPNVDNVVPQFRLWQQFLFVQPFNRAKLYHQIRLEQRWRRSYVKDSPFLLTYRFRYKLMMYLPLNKPHLVNNTLFFVAYDEIFIQAGRSIIFDHMEDNRLFLGLGYILNENIQLQAGYTWTFRHAGAPNKYEHRHIPRISVYHNLDFYKKREDRKKYERNRMILKNEF